MHITIEPKALSSELYKLLGVTSSKGPMNIVANALLTARDDNTLRLEATDLEVSVSTTVACEVIKPGQLCLNAHNLHNVIKGLDGKKAEITAQDNQWAHLRSGDVDCRIVGLPPVEFPKLPGLDDLKTANLPTTLLLDAIERTIFAISTDEGRPNLMGAYFELRGSTLLMVATDGHRLSKVVREVEAVGSVPPALAEGIIIPKKSLAELRRTADTSVPDVLLGTSGNNAVFQFGKTTLIVRLVDASFPDYRRVIPEQAVASQARINTQEFGQKLKFVSLFSNPRTNNITLTLDGDLLEISASDPETGEAKETMPSAYIGPRVQLGFNYRYLTDVVGILKEPELRLQVTDAFSAALVLDGERPDDLFLVMPMRL